MVVASLHLYNYCSVAESNANILMVEQEHTIKLLQFIDNLILKYLKSYGSVKFRKPLLLGMLLDMKEKTIW